MKGSDIGYCIVGASLLALVVSIVAEWEAGILISLIFTLWFMWKARHETVLEQLLEIKERLDKRR